jgi:hypothetical protein
MSIEIQKFRKLPLHQQLVHIFPRDLCKQIWRQSLDCKLSLVFGKSILNPIELTNTIYTYHGIDEYSPDSPTFFDLMLEHYGQKKLILFGICQEVEEGVNEYLQTQSKKANQKEIKLLSITNNHL